MRLHHIVKSGHNVSFISQIKFPPDEKALLAIRVRSSAISALGSYGCFEGIELKKEKQEIPSHYIFKSEHNISFILQIKFPPEIPGKTSSRWELLDWHYYKNYL